jgi:predicted nucleic acid-binding protein
MILPDVDVLIYAFRADTPEHASCNPWLTAVVGSDAWFAALAIEWDCEWITFDRDYARFPGLKWSAPAV